MFLSRLISGSWRGRRRTNTGVWRVLFHPIFSVRIGVGVFRVKAQIWVVLVFGLVLGSL